MSERRMKIAGILLLLLMCSCSSLFGPSNETDNARVPSEKTPGSSLSAHNFAARGMLSWKSAEVELQKAEGPPRVLLRDTPEVRRFLWAYTSDQRSFVTKGLERRKPFMSVIEKELVDQGLPIDLANVAFIESHFQPEATGSGTKGMWQLTIDTARSLGLKVSFFRDERKDVSKSTRAAAKYLSDLHERFDDWLLAIAAYNYGPAKIDRALEQSTSRDFFELSRQGWICKDVTNFVAKFIALSLITRNPDVYGFSSSEQEHAG
jgi:membrane-bound lytic murein transglycosylase D